MKNSDNTLLKLIGAFTLGAAAGAGAVIAAHFIKPYLPKCCKSACCEEDFTPCDDIQCECDCDCTCESENNSECNCECESNCEPTCECGCDCQESEQQ